MTYYKKGSSNFECDVCRDWCKAEEKKLRWDGLITCKDCWDPKPWFTFPYPKVRDLIPVKNPRFQVDFEYSSPTFGESWNDDPNYWGSDVNATATWDD